MKTLAKVIAWTIDVALFPLRALLGLEIVVAAAILSDESIKEAVKGYMNVIMEYPELLKESTKNIFS